MSKKTTGLLLESLWVLFIVWGSSAAFAQTITLPPLSSSIIFTDPIQSNNMFLGVEGNPSGEGYTEITTLNGVPCRKIAAGKFMYCYSSRSAVPTTANNLILAITYWDNSMNSLWVNYTRSGNANGWGVGDFQKSNTGKWITRLISLSDAGLDGSMGYGGDIRMGNGSEDNYIKDISIYTGALNPDAEPVPSQVNNPGAEFRGKSFAGYQLWHQAGPNPQDWAHWAYGKLPAAGRGNHNTEMFPIIADYEGNPNITMYATNYANLGNGKPARLYNSTDEGVIDVQMNLLQKAGFDGVAIQRNAPVGQALKYTATDDYYVSIKNACEATGRLFYVMYCMPDVNNGDTASANLVAGIKRDWVYQMEQIYRLTSSTAYATVNGKPVVELWGLGYTTISVNKTQALELAQFFKDRGCYVIAGTPRDFRLRNEGSRTDFEDVYKAFDMISPWTVGAFNDTIGADNFKTNYLIPDKAYCDQNGLGYYPVAMPGSAWSQHVSGYPNDTKRLAGKFFWKQVLNIKSIGVSSMYYAMLDEFEESTNYIGAGVDYFDIPTDQYFGTFSMDGIWTSSDYYLRLGGAAARMLTSASSPTEIPIPYSNGPTYYRNSFESRIANCLINNVAEDILAPIDACFYHDAVLSNTGVTGGSVSIVNESSNTKSGIYSVKATGTTSSGTASNYYYQVSETKIGVKANMQLSFWKYSVDALGQYTSVDLVFQSGKRLSTLAGYVDNKGYAMSPTVARGPIGVWEQFTCQIGVGELIGDELIGIVIGYDHPSVSGSYNAYFDDIIIEDAQAVTRVETPYLGSAFPIPGKIEAEYYDYGGEGLAYNDSDEENKFNLYRVDEGVDIESTGDVGGGYDVGWIETGEWMNYMVNVTTTGQYTLEVRVASGNVGTKSMHVEMDGVDISGLITFSVSSGWQSYQTISVTTPVLTAGAKVMRVYIDGGGFNLNYVNYNSLVATGVTESEGMSAVTVYPNPVKGGSSITIQQTNQEAGMSQIRLYNYLGQVVLETTGDTSSNVLLPLPQQLSSGYYQLEVTGQSGKSTMQKLLIY